MSAQIISFPDRRGNRPAPVNPPVNAASKLRAHCHKLRLSDNQRYTVLRAVSHWEQVGLDEATVIARAMAMANRLVQPDPTGPRAA